MKCTKLFVHTTEMKFNEVVDVDDIDKDRETK